MVVELLGGLGERLQEGVEDPTAGERAAGADVEADQAGASLAQVLGRPVGAEPEVGDVLLDEGAGCRGDAGGVLDHVGDRLVADPGGGGDVVDRHGTAVLSAASP